MTTPVIIDAFAVILLLCFTIFGVRRGLLRSLAGLIIVVVALVGAGMVAATFSGPAAKLVTPLIETHLSERVAEAVATQDGPSIDWEGDNDQTNLIPALLERLGVDEDAREAMAEQIRESLADAGDAVSEAVVTSAVVESLARSLLYGVLYILAFLLLLLVLKILLEAMNLVARLPGLHGLNAIGGGLLGLMEGTLLLFLAIWVARRLGVSFETAPYTDTYVLRFFTTNTPLSLLSFLQ